MSEEGRETPGLPTVTVVIPAHNEAEHIERCVRSCWEQTYRPDEVVVIADSCTDETARIAREAGARVVETHFKLKAANINHVLPSVTSDVVAIIDADSYYAPASLEQFARTVAEGFDATCAALFPMPEQRTSMIVAYRRFLYAVDKRWGRPIQQSIGRFYVLAGPASAFRVSALRAVGGYLERKGEDAFLTWELYRHGYKLGFTGKATVYTLEPTSWKSYLQQTDRWHSDFCQLTLAYWREYRRPRVLLVSGGAIWDTVTYPLVLLYWMVSLIIKGPSGVHVPAVMWWLLVGIMLAQTAVAVKGLGFRTAMAYLPSFIALGHVDIIQKFWVLVREWVFGRQALSWTGRQGRKAELTPMPKGRRRVFTGSTAVIVLWVTLTFGTTAGVMEATGVLPHPSPPGTARDDLSPVPAPTGNSETRHPAHADAADPKPQTRPATSAKLPTRVTRPPAADPHPRPPAGTTRPDDRPKDPPSHQPSPQPTAPPTSPSPSPPPSSSPTPTPKTSANPPPSGTP